MYYKITDKGSELFKRGKELVDRIKMINQENEKKFKEFVGFEFVSMWVSNGIMLTDYIHGIKPIEGTDPDGNWKRETTVDGICYVPDKKKKRGREIANFMRKELQYLSYIAITESVLKIEDRLFGRFTISRIYGDDDTVLVLLDDRFDPEDEALIEVTRTEFLRLYKELKS